MGIIIFPKNKNPEFPATIRFWHLFHNCIEIKESQCGRMFKVLDWQWIDPGSRKQRVAILMQLKKLDFVFIEGSLESQDKHRRVYFSKVVRG